MRVEADAAMTMGMEWGKRKRRPPKKGEKIGSRRRSQEEEEERGEKRSQKKRKNLVVDESRRRTPLLSLSFSLARNNKVARVERARTHTRTHLAAL